MPQNPENQKQNPEKQKGPEVGSLEWGVQQANAIDENIKFVQEQAKGTQGIEGDKTGLTENDLHILKNMQRILASEERGYSEKRPTTPQDRIEANERAEKICVDALDKSTLYNTSVEKGYIEKGTPFERELKGKLERGHNSAEIADFLRKNIERCQLVDKERQPFIQEEGREGIFNEKTHTAEQIKAARTTATPGPTIQAINNTIKRQIEDKEKSDQKNLEEKAKQEGIQLDFDK